MRDSHPEILEGELGLSGLEALVLKGPSGDEGPTWHPAKVVVQGDEGVEVMNPQDVSTTMIVGSLEGLVGRVCAAHASTAPPISTPIRRPNPSIQRAPR